MLTMWGLVEIRDGSLVTSVRVIRTRSLRWQPFIEVGGAEHERRGDRYVGVERTRSLQGQHAVAEHLRPHPHRGRRSVRPCSAASGTAPIPAWSVAPSSEFADRESRSRPSASSGGESAG